jgi:hypothetical protein
MGGYIEDNLSEIAGGVFIVHGKMTMKTLCRLNIIRGSNFL